MNNSIFEKRFLFYKKYLLEKKERFGELEFSSAILKKFLPHIKPSDYLDFIALTQTFSYMALYDLRNFKADKIKVHKNYERHISGLKAGGNIICTYHCGSYRTIPLFLLLKNVPFKLVTDNKFIQEQGKEIQEQLKKYSTEYNTDQKELEIISAEEKQGIFKCIRSLRQGFNLLFFIDGNRGVSNTYDGNNLALVKLFNSTFPSRIGLAYLAKASSAKIYPIINIRSDEYYSRIKFFEPIVPVLKKDNDYISAKTTTQKLYNILEKALKDNLAQWEGWLYLHLFVKPGKDVIQDMSELVDSNDKYKFNEDDYGLMRIRENYLLFDKNTFLTYPVSDVLHLTLKYYKNGNKANHDIKIGKYNILQSALNELKAKKILVIENHQQ